MKSASLGMQKSINGMLSAAAAGGRALLQAPRTPAVTKADGSPVTAADLASDRAIRDVLAKRFPTIPCISEENTGEENTRNTELDAADDLFFLVDPLDGTKEYLAGHADFAVCIGLVYKRKPIAGIILAPALQRVWIASGTAVSFELDAALRRQKTTRKLLRVQQPTHEPLRIVTSRSHADGRSLALLQTFPGSQHQSMGSAVKFTALCSGDVDLYPRGTGSMEWDTAAAEALLMAAGGIMLDEFGQPLLYGKKASEYRNGPFIAASSEALLRRALDQWKP